MYYYFIFLHLPQGIVIDCGTWQIVNILFEDVVPNFIGQLISPGEKHIKNKNWKKTVTENGKVLGNYSTYLET